MLSPQSKLATSHNRIARQRFIGRPWWTRLLTRRIQLALDVSVISLAFVVAYLLRFDFSLPPEWARQMLMQAPYVVLLQFIALHLAGGHSFIWRYTGFAEARVFVNAFALCLIVFVALRFGLPANFARWRVPMSVAIIDTSLAFGGTLGVRVLRRALYERFERQRTRSVHLTTERPKAVLLIGAGRAGVMAAKEINGRADINVEVKGFVDDDPGKQGTVINRYKVLGPVAELPRLVRELEIDHVIISIAQASRRELRDIMEVCEKIPIRARIVPGIYELLQGSVEINRLRDVQIDDLLGREPVQLDVEGLQRLLAGKIVLVTGAGGSIGSELARQIALFKPRTLLLVERAEWLLFRIHRELTEAWPDLDIIPLLADVGERTRMRALLEAYCPSVVLHAAAHKHVPMMETNVVEALRNNSLATYTLGALCGECGVETFVLVSTDKAVKPTSVMGATKRFAELIVQDLNCQFETRFVAVRFGNVIGSVGSVIPIFQEQIRKGGPVTVTHPDMVRYFMTIPEASRLVLAAGAIAEGGEIFILDMGEPIRILDLAQDTVKLSGLKPYEDIDIIFTGIRPGEKLAEELQINSEAITKTRHPKIFIGKIAAYPAEVMRDALAQAKLLEQGNDDQSIRTFLVNLIGEARLDVAGQTLAGMNGTTQTQVAQL